MLEIALRGGQGLVKLKTVESGGGNTDTKQDSADATTQHTWVAPLQQVTVWRTCYVFTNWSLCRSNYNVTWCVAHSSVKRNEVILVFVILSHLSFLFDVHCVNWKWLCNSRISLIDTSWEIWSILRLSQITILIVIVHWLCAWYMDGKQWKWRSALVLLLMPQRVTQLFQRTVTRVELCHT